MVSRLGDPFTTDPVGVLGVAIVEDVSSFRLTSDRSWTPSVNRESSRSSRSSEESSLQDLYTVVFSGSSFVLGEVVFGVWAGLIPTPRYCRISLVFSSHCDSVNLFIVRICSMEQSLHLNLERVYTYSAMSIAVLREHLQCTNDLQPLLPSHFRYLSFGNPWLQYLHIVSWSAILVFGEFLQKIALN